MLKKTDQSDLPLDEQLSVAAPDADAFFSVRDIHAYYGESYIVQGISFDLREGEILALLGRNGAGKTSTLRTLARVDDPALHSGEIYLGGESLHDKKSFQAAQLGVQLVPEDRRIIGGLTVEENLILAQVSEPRGLGAGTHLRAFPAAGRTPHADRHDAVGR